MVPRGKSKYQNIKSSKGGEFCQRVASRELLWRGERGGEEIHGPDQIPLLAVAMAAQATLQQLTPHSVVGISHRRRCVWGAVADGPLGETQHRTGAFFSTFIPIVDEVLSSAEITLLISRQDGKPWY